MKDTIIEKRLDTTLCCGSCKYAEKYIPVGCGRPPYDADGGSIYCRHWKARTYALGGVCVGGWYRMAKELHDFEKGKTKRR